MVGPVNTIPHEWARIQMSGVAPTDREFAELCQSLNIDPDKSEFALSEMYRLVVEVIRSTRDAHYKLCQESLHPSSWENALRIMSTAKNLREALDICKLYCDTLYPQNRIDYRIVKENVVFETNIREVETERAGAAEITSTLSRYSGLCWFLGDYITVKHFLVKSRAYARLFSYCPEMECSVEASDSTAIIFDKTYLDAPRRPGLGPEVFHDSLRWVVLADKFKPVMRDNKRPLMSAEKILQELRERAAHRNISHRQLCRYAKQENGISLRDLELCAKAHRAMMLLALSTRTTEEISAELGFSSVRAFRRSFQGVVGMPPSVYRGKFSELGTGQSVDEYAEMLRSLDRIRGENPV